MEKNFKAARSWLSNALPDIMICLLLFIDVNFYVVPFFTNIFVISRSFSLVTYLFKL